MWCQSLSVQVSAWVSADEPKKSRCRLVNIHYEIHKLTVSLGWFFFVSFDKILFRSSGASRWGLAIISFSMNLSFFFTCIKVQRIPNSMCKSDTSRRLQSSLNVCVFLAFPPGFSLMLLLTLLNKHELESKLMSLNLTCQWWNTDRAKAWPCVCVRRSVSKPNESMAGMKALIV